MNGLQEVSRMKQRLDDTFERIKTIDPGSLELQKDFARYLCVLVSGYVERAIAQIVQEHARRNGSPTLQKFVEAKTNRFTNAKTGKIMNFLGSFDKDWHQEIERYLAEGSGEAIDSVVSNRHQIAHGGDSQITYSQIRDYYTRAQELVNRVERLCLGTGHFKRGSGIEN